MLITIVTFILVLSLLVFVHELGHFWTARKFGVKAEEFGFGFPPRAFGVYKSLDGSWKKVSGKKEVHDAADTIFSINWIPLGGFVKIKGEDGEDANEADSFSSRKIWQRAVILLAGVTMNIVLAAFLFSVGYLIGLPQTLDEVGRGAIVSHQQVQVIEIFPESPAAGAGLLSGDVIKSVNSVPIESANELQELLAGNQDQELEVLVSSAGEETVKKITPVWLADLEKPGIGISLAETGLVRYPVHLAVWNGIKVAIFYTWFIALAFYELIKGLVLGQGLSIEIGGPVRIAEITGNAARMGFSYLINFSALLSINLAIINAFPFPALDGGRLLFLLIEKIKGSPVKREVEAVIHNIGFALLMVLVILVTYKDIIRLF